MSLIQEMCLSGYCFIEQYTFKGMSHELSPQVESLDMQM